MGVDWMRVCFGENAVHVPVTLTIQEQGDGTVIIIGASRVPAKRHPLLLGSAEPHVHILGDAIFRPSWAGEANLRGYGAAGLLTSSSFADPSQWRTILGTGARGGM